MTPLTCNSKLRVSAGLYSHSWSIQSVFRPTGSASVLSSGRCQWHVCVGELTECWSSSPPRSWSCNELRLIHRLDGCRNTESSHWCSHAASCTDTARWLKHAEREAPIPPPLPPRSPAQFQSDLALHAERNEPALERCSPMEAQTSDGSYKSISDTLPQISFYKF